MRKINRSYPLLVLTSVVLSLSWVLWAEGLSAKKTKILILGDSLTEGYGIEKDDAFPKLLEQKLNQGLNRFQVINGGSSGSTSASAGQRLKWYGKTNPDLVLLALGSNDGLRGVKPEETKKNIEVAILYCKERKWPVILVGLQIPPNYGKDFSEAFKKVFPDLAQKYQIPLMPFLLENVAGEKNLNQNDGLHPNEAGHAKIAENLFHFLEPFIGFKSFPNK